MLKKDQFEPQLTPKQDRLIELLLSGINVSAAAKETGIADVTARRWLKDEHFLVAYRQAQQMLFDQALTGLMHKVEKAIATLDRNMDADISIPASTQVRAAQIVLEQCIAIRKTAELEQKILELEEYIQELIKR